MTMPSLTLPRSLHFLRFLKLFINNQVTNAAWDVGVEVLSENPLPFLDRVGYNKILDNAKPLADPDGRYLSSFIYHRLGPLLLERQNLMEFERFVKRMHGKALGRYFSS